MKSAITLPANVCERATTDFRDLFTASPPRVTKSTGYAVLFGSHNAGSPSRPRAMAGRISGMGTQQAKRRGPIGWLATRSRMFWRFAILASLLWLYVLSFGLACRFSKNNGPVARADVVLFYKPLVALADRSPAMHRVTRWWSDNVFGGHFKGIIEQYRYEKYLDSLGDGELPRDDWNKVRSSDNFR